MTGREQPLKGEKDGLDHPAGQIEMMDGSFKPCPLCLALDQLKALRG